MQTRTQSMVEVVTGILVGFGINLIGNLIVVPLLGGSINLQQGLVVGLGYTVVSFIRGYGLRRLFNWLHRTT